MMLTLLHKLSFICDSEINDTKLSSYKLRIPHVKWTVECDRHP